MEACKAFMYGQTFIILCDVTWWSKQTMVADRKTKTLTTPPPRSLSIPIFTAGWCSQSNLVPLMRQYYPTRD